MASIFVACRSQAGRAEVEVWPSRLQEGFDIGFTFPDIDLRDVLLNPAVSGQNSKLF
jgi:hypothetical protein